MRKEVSSLLREPPGEMESFFLWTLLVNVNLELLSHLATSLRIKPTHKESNTKRMTKK